MIDFSTDAHQAATVMVPISTSSAVEASVLVHLDTSPAPRGGAALFWDKHRWWIMRLLWLPVHIAAFATAAFFLVRLVPGDPVLARMDTSGGFNQAEYDAAAKSMGLSGSIFDQLGVFWGNLIQGNLGVSQVTGRPIWTEIITRLPSTIELIALGLGGSIILALILAHAQMFSSNPTFHRFIKGYGKFAGAVPDFAIAVFGLVIFYSILRIIPPPIGRVTPGLTATTITGFPLLDALLSGNTAVFASIVGHYVLPVVVMILVYTPNIWKQLTLGVTEQAGAPSTLFKIASGATRGSIYRSILRRSAASAVVMVGALFGGLLGGVVVLETLFGFGGLGQFAVTSVENLDFLGLQGFLVVVAALCLIAYFFVDIINMILDPRRKPGARAAG